MLQYTDLPLMCGIYSFVDDNGHNTHIYVDGIRKWVKDNKPIVVGGPVDDEIAKDMFKNNVVSEERLKQLLKHPELAAEPLIYGIRDYNKDNHPNVMLIDGHHRYVLAAMAKIPIYPSILLLKSVWEQFQIAGFDKLYTKEKLQATPTWQPHHSKVGGLYWNDEEMRMLENVAQLRKKYKTDETN